MKEWMNENEWMNGFFSIIQPFSSQSLDRDCPDEEFSR